MKKILYFILLVFSGASFISCEDQLDAPSVSTLDQMTIFSNVALTSRAVDAILEPMGQTNSYRGRFLTYYGANTDMEWLLSTTPGPKADLCVYSADPSNTEMNRDNVYWAMVYIGIERANLCIQGIRAYGDPQPGTAAGIQLGRALTFRAIYYADLMKAHGDVIARFEPVTPETIYIPKSDRGVIYKQLIADLEEAGNLVPWPNASAETASTEQVNKAFIKGFRARLCMVAAGYSKYSDGIRRSNDPDLSVANLYPIALKECEDVILSGAVKLEEDFVTIWKKEAQEVVTAGGESLWEIPFAAGRGRHFFTFAVPHESVDKYSGQNRGGTFGPLPTVFYDYEQSDLRRDITCVPYQWGKVDALLKDKLAIQVLSTGTSTPSVANWFFGKFRYEWMTRPITNPNDDGVNKIYMRYAEVLLMAAELENEIGTLEKAKGYLKQIRKRAFANDAEADAYVDAISSKEAMFDAIVKEHGLEFCGEMERKQALIRWNLLTKKLEQAKEKMRALAARTGEYADVPETIYYRYKADNETLEIYGLNRGEDADKSAEFSSAPYVSETKLDEAKINALYTNDPDQNQFWPIWQYFIDGSNGTLVND